MNPSAVVPWLQAVEEKCHGTKTPHPRWYQKMRCHGSLYGMSSGIVGLTKSGTMDLWRGLVFVAQNAMAREMVWLARVFFGLG